MEMLTAMVEPTLAFFQMRIQVQQPNAAAPRRHAVAVAQELSIPFDVRPVTAIHEHPSRSGPPDREDLNGERT